MAVLIPCIDLMDGKVVQLVGGKEKSLEFDDIEPWITKFAAYPLVHIVDLNAALRNGSNCELIAQLSKRLPCQVGGGIRDTARAAQILDAGAKRVVIGSALYSENDVDQAFAEKLAAEIGRERLVFSVDCKRGRIAIHGWRTMVDLTAEEAVNRLQAFCGAFLYTNVDTEGAMAGFPIGTAKALAAATDNHLIVGGGIRSIDEVDELDKIGIDAVVGMAVYSGRI